MYIEWKYLRPNYLKISSLSTSEIHNLPISNNRYFSSYYRIRWSKNGTMWVCYIDHTYIYGLHFIMESVGKSICIYHSYIMCSTDVRGPKQCWCLWQEPFFQLTYPIFCLLPSWLVNPRGYFYHHPFGSSRDRVSVKVYLIKCCGDLFLWNRIWA